jgi:hypothetical protein
MAGRRGQRWLTQAERLEIRRRVATGEPFGSIATSIGRTTRTIHNIIARDGSVPPRDSVRSSLRLSIAEREEISRGLRGGESLRRIAVRPAGRPRPSRARWRATEAGAGTGPTWPRCAPPPGPADHAAPSSPAIAPCAGTSSGCSRRAGRPSRSPGSCATIILTSGRCGCPTRRSISRCSCRAGVRCGPS